jgi:hypothetical protein
MATKATPADARPGRTLWLKDHGCGFRSSWKGRRPAPRASKSCFAIQPGELENACSTHCIARRRHRMADRGGVRRGRRPGRAWYHQIRWAPDKRGANSDGLAAQAHTRWDPWRGPSLRERR